MTQIRPRWVATDSRGTPATDFWQWVSQLGQGSRPCRPISAAMTLDSLYCHHCNYEIHTVDADITQDVPDGLLFRIPDGSATTIHREKRLTMDVTGGPRCSHLANQEADGPSSSGVKPTPNLRHWLHAIPDAIEVLRLDATQRRRSPLSMRSPLASGA
jgi:hypothetical protein